MKLTKSTPYFQELLERDCSSGTWKIQHDDYPDKGLICLKFKVGERNAYISLGKGQAPHAKIENQPNGSIFVHIFWVGLTRDLRRFKMPIKRAKKWVTRIKRMHKKYPIDFDKMPDQEVAEFFGHWSKEKWEHYQAPPTSFDDTPSWGEWWDKFYAL